MKLQLDLKNKVIKVEESANLGEFIEALKKLFPDGKWKEFTMETQTVINWSNPIYVQPWSKQWWEGPYYGGITYTSGTTNGSELLNIKVEGN